jgi:hypothetical protein
MRNRLSILVANISILLLALPAPAFAFDTDGPSVGAVVVSPSSVDISQSAVTVTATVTATDLSGVDQTRLPRANFYNMSDVGTMRSFTLVLKSGDAKNGTYQASYTVPINAKPGNWSVLVDGFVDLGGYRSTNGSHEGLFKVMTNATFDTNGPSVGAISISPSVADISQSAVTVTAIVSATDESGVDQTRLPMANFLNPSDVSTMRSFPMVLKTGDAKNGTYQVSFTVPINAKPGNWAVWINGFLDLGGYRSTNGSHEGLFKVIDAAGKAAADKAAADKAAADKAAADKAAADKAAADKAAADKAAADKAAADKAAADKAAADKAAADKAAADKAGITKMQQVEFEIVKNDYETMMLRILNLKVKFPNNSNLMGMELKMLKLPISLGSDLTTAKNNIVSVNKWLDGNEKVWEKTQKKTITCVKGKVFKKVTGINPKCPSGYKRK